MKIIITYVKPPVPDQSNDWQAVLEGEEEYGPAGHGETWIDAVQDLLDQKQEGL